MILINKGAYYHRHNLYRIYDIPSLTVSGFDPDGVGSVEESFVSSGE